ncbi:WbqC family protein [Desulfovibrio sp. JC010]|uniref:WbqC family protein n=1 Tax=Desulfovibrio sp. JC010 TaxID=2593641 RepID=UPI0013D3BAA2|nr:WbqC family protein [Desulfovibrio sp. JC010]NDV27166.1 WbqC family protein [Desulfovibrio sp. JC010]
MSKKKVAILQSNYIPWKGYFDMIAAVDEFILYDDMQYTRRDWRNRNKIKTPQGTTWLSVPVKVKGKYHQTIAQTEIDGTNWADQHWKSLSMHYRRAPYFDEIIEMLEPLYKKDYKYLSELNRSLIECVCNYLNIDTKISSSQDYTLIEGKTERLVDLCIQAGGTEYISGPAAKDYVDETVFEKNNIKLTWFEYGKYPEYPQLWGDFVHQVSIVDMLFNCGQNAGKYMNVAARNL